MSQNKNESVTLPKWVYDDVVSRLETLRKGLNFGSDRDEVSRVLGRLDAFRPMGADDRAVWDDHARKVTRKRNEPWSSEMRKANDKDIDNHPY